MIASMTSGSTVKMSPTMPKSATLKIGVSGSLLIAIFHVVLVSIVAVLLDIAMYENSPLLQVKTLQELHCLVTRYPSGRKC